MSFARAVLAAFLGGLLAIVLVLAWRASQRTGKSIPASLPDVPAEAQLVASDVKVRASEAVNSGVQTIKERIVGGEGDEVAEAAGPEQA